MSNEAEGTQRVTLSPRWLPAVGLALLGCVLAWIVLVLVRADVVTEAAGAILALIALSVSSMLAVGRYLAARRTASLEVSSDAFTVSGITIERDRVATVRHHTELLFKGVRIDLRDGSWIGVPVHLHYPRRVIGAFRRFGYPVGGPRAPDAGGGAVARGGGPTTA